MKIQMLIGAAAAGAVGVYLACVPGQPTPSCPVGHGAFAAKYTLKSGTGPCASLPGDVIGLQKYFPKVDGNPSTLAIRTSRLADKAVEGRTVGTGSVDAIGSFTTEQAEEDDFCRVPTLTATALSLDPVAADADAGTAAQPAEQHAEVWKNVRIYSTAAAAGTQMAADLTYTQDNCTAEYSVSALWPAVSCADEDGNADPTLCEITKDARDRYVLPCDEGGHCVNPDFKIKCDPGTLLCVLDGEVPALSTQ